jgi:hypothetical protein
MATAWQTSSTNAQKRLANLPSLAAQTVMGMVLLTKKTAALTKPELLNFSAAPTVTKMVTAWLTKTTFAQMPLAPR